MEHFSKSGRGVYRRRRKGKSPKFAVFLCFILAASLLLYYDVIPAHGLKRAVGNVASTVTESLKEAAHWGGEKIGFNDQASFAFPVSSGVVTEEFGVVLNDAGEENYHGGIDIRIPDGSEVLAAEAGEFTAMDTHDNGTKWVTVKHSGDWSTVYGRLRDTPVVMGDTVEKGTSLGTPKGDTLHFEVLQTGEQKNPVAYFNVN